MRNFLIAILCLTLVGFAIAQTATSTTQKPAATKPAASATTAPQPVQAIFETTMGNITCTLFPDKAPVTVDNFIGLATGTKDWKNPASGATMHKKPLYDGTVFHRVIKNFMIQGGGFQPGMKEKRTKAPIKNESGNGLSNSRGAIAMARTNALDSATAQFYINVVDNRALDGHKYCVFGKVIEGMDVVDKIREVSTTSKGPHDDVPSDDVVIKSVRRAADSTK